MFSYPFASHQSHQPYFGSSPYQNPYGSRKSYYQPKQYYNDLNVFNPYDEIYHPTYKFNYDPYEEEIRRRNTNQQVPDKHSSQHEKLNSSQTEIKNSNKQQQFQNSQTQRQDQKTEQKQQQSTSTNSFENKPEQKDNLNLESLPLCMRIDSKTTIQEEKVNYWKELNSTPDKNNLKEGLIEEKYPEEIEKKAEKLSTLVKREYSFCLQVVLKNPDYSLGQYIDLILNKQSKKEQK